MVLDIRAARPARGLQTVTEQQNQQPHDVENGTASTATHVPNAPHATTADTTMSRPARTSSTSTKAKGIKRQSSNSGGGGGGGGGSSSSVIEPSSSQILASDDKESKETSKNRAAQWKFRLSRLLSTLRFRAAHFFKSRKDGYILMMLLMTVLLMVGSQLSDALLKLGIFRSGPGGAYGNQARYILHHDMKCGDPEPVGVIDSEVDILRRELDGVSLIAACKNRLEKLPVVIKNWEMVDGLNEIVLVDWDSDIPISRVLSTQGIAVDNLKGDEAAPGGSSSTKMANGTCIRILRVENEPQWVLSRAYNLAARLARYKTLLRLDCDHVVSAEIMSKHVLKKNMFFAGDWSAARSANEVHLNGAMIIKRADFWRVGGYDERITTYGWDDEDFYIRLQKAGLERKKLNYDYIAHLLHADSKRAQRGVRFVQVEVDFNRLLLDKLSPWKSTVKDRSVYQVQGSSVATALKKPVGLLELVDSKSIADSWNLALGRRLHDQYGVPWDVIIPLDTMNREIALGSFEELDREMNPKLVNTVRKKNQPKMIIMHVQHGLGNRLRALGSAMAFANSTRRPLFVIWEADKHCRASYPELFEVGANVTFPFAVLPYFKTQWPFLGAEKWDSAWANVDKFNYMEVEGKGAKKGEIVVSKSDKHIYVKSAYIIETDNPSATNWDKDNTFLRMLRPVEAVRTAVSDMEAQGLLEMIGVHIRNRKLEEDISDVSDYVKEYGAEAAKTMEQWREASNYRIFMSYMREIRQQDPTARFFVATDTKSVYAELEAVFPGGIYKNERECDGRDAKCVVAALIDIYCLSSARRFIGSNWSSFSEIIQRIGGKKGEIAGVDFGF
eukprot:CAMPEP_0184699368 /NCGR_PEP_ID=MMETSP0313-20130426/5663_1 /TAXON_ID=2792 /ORGANISM="Porphyridium aerugineum, Strain SAG 1380-2" /LENGTH=840 /DNA_ID=CAMNT_0027158443 /DNA_START=100 /DNA_END=2622 /DNA_ORIENTATION=-